MSIIILLVCVILAGGYLVLTGSKRIEKLLNGVKEFKPTLDAEMDKRFSLYEGLIAKVEEHMSISETFLKDIVQLRTEACAARKSDDTLREFTAESKISLVSSNLSKIIGDYSELKKDKEISRIVKIIKEQEQELQDVILKYNVLLDSYQNAILGFPGALIIKVKPQLYKSFPYNR